MSKRAPPVDTGPREGYQSTGGGLKHRLSVASQVYDHWTMGGSYQAGLAERFTDGSISALEEYVRSPELSQSDEASSLSHSSSIDRRRASELTYDAFVAEYMRPNKPVMIQDVNNRWLAASQWVEGRGSINFDFLDRQFGGAHVCITASAGKAGYGHGKRMKMTFHEYTEKWLSGAAHSEGLYLKDWHFVNEFPDYEAYVCPKYFTDDWLNAYYDIQQSRQKARSEEAIATSDYRFVYLGPKGTSTPVHADVLRSFSWSTNIAGRKRWKLLAPEHTPLLMDRFGQDMAPDFNLEGPGDQFPNLKQAAALVITIEQGVNEVLFLPSGWHHSVDNMEDTLSINHNWLNGHNIHHSWALLQEEHRSASRAIEDCRELCGKAEFEDLVQRNMQANCSFSYFSMAHFLGTIALREMQCFTEKACKDELNAGAALRKSLELLREIAFQLQGLYQIPDNKSDAASRQISGRKLDKGIIESLVNLPDKMLDTNLDACARLHILRSLLSWANSCLETLNNDRQLNQD